MNKISMTVFSIRISERFPTDNSFTIMANCSSNLTLFYVWYGETAAMQVFITYI